MANRHLSRSIALQSLFEWDFHDYDDKKLTEIVNRNIAEFAPGLEDSTFIHTLVKGVVGRRPKLNLIIGKAALDWPIEQIAAVDRNILRLGLYELLFADKKEVPARVAINEAIELAKTFGGETSSKFINGVLGAVYKEMGEPGKDEVPVKKKHPKDIPYDQMLIEQLGGAVIYCQDGQEVFLALVHDIFGHWTLSKGHIEANEDVEEATIRKIKEEISLDIIVQKPLGKNEYVSSDPEKGRIRKQVNYFLAEAKNKKSLKLDADKSGLDDARWFRLSEVAELRIYDDVVPFITKAVKILLSKMKTTTHVFP